MSDRPTWLSVMLDDWQRRLSALFTGLLLLQFVFWIQEEQTVWLRETVILVEWTLLLTFLMELLPKPVLWFRLLLQFCIILFFNLIAVGYRPVGGSLKSWNEVIQLWNDNAGQLHPYFWFSFGAWLVYLYANWWVTRKWRIGVLLGVSVLAFAARDSFSLLQLWDEVAMVVLCGLSLLVICHFQQLKRKNPTGWAYLAEYPVSAVLPIVLFLGGVMIVGVLMPSVPPTVKDPYTAYLEWQGAPVPALGKGLPTISASGSASSGYGRNDQSLGGGFDYNFDPVMTVDTTHKAYWRGETRSLYNGKGWEETDADKQSGVGAVAAENELQQDARLQNSKLQFVEVRQTVTMEKPESFPVLFGAFSISKILDLNGETVGFDRLSWSSRQQELRFKETRDGKGYPQTYTIISQMPVLDEAGLRTTQTELPTGQNMDEYLQLPATLPQRVKDLVQQITANGTNPYDKVKLLESYLQTSFPYTNKPDTSLGKSKDFVDRFLFEIKQGYCDYYSTALAVMTRVIGIPSRWVKGYSTGQAPIADVDEFIQEQIEGTINPDGAGIYTVRNSDAHSWVEVYFPGWGWIPFEPTAGFAMPAAVLPQEVEPLPDLPTVVTEPAVQEDEGAKLSRGTIVTTVSIAVLVILVAAAVVIGLRTKPWQRLLRGEGQASNLNQRIIAEYNRLIRYSRRRGYPYRDTDTVRETFSRWNKKDAWLHKDLQRITSLFEKAKYSGRPITNEEAAQMTQLVKKLREEM